MVEATLSSESGWIDAKCIDLPPITLKHIHLYFITARLHKKWVTASKPFERGYRLFSSRKVQCLSIHEVTSNPVYGIICATVLPSQKSGAYKTAIALSKTNGHAIYGSCTCVAGNSACNYTAALMFAIACELALFLSRSALYLARGTALVFTCAMYGVACTVLHIERQIISKDRSMYCIF